MNTNSLQYKHVLKLSTERLVDQGVCNVSRPKKHSFQLFLVNWHQNSIKPGGR